jgi:hypothetical protein
VCIPNPGQHLFHVSMRMFEDQIKRHTRESQKYTYTLLLVPRTSTLVTQILEEEGVLGEVTINSYNLQFIPIAEDVLSLEADNAFKEIWVVSVQSPPACPLSRAGCRMATRLSYTTQRRLFRLCKSSTASFHGSLGKGIMLP